MMQRMPPKHALNIVDRPLTKNRAEVPTVSLSAMAYLYSELIQYSMERTSNLQELEERLRRIGHDVGVRVLELLSYRERALKRKVDVPEVLKWIQATAWPYLFGKAADELQQAVAADDEFHIRDYNLSVSKFISRPKQYASFEHGSLAAGIVHGMLDGAGFPSRVTAHTEPSKNNKGKPVTTFLVKFDDGVMKRQALLEEGRRG